MALKIVANTGTVKVQATVEQPGDFGKTLKSTLNVEFRRLDRDEIDSLLADFRDELANLPARETWRAQENLLCKVVTGFSDVVDENGEAVAYSEETLRLLLKSPHVLVAIDEAMKRALRVKDLREKN